MLLPAPTFNSVVDYVATGLGIILGFAILSAPMTAIQDAVKKQA